MGNNTNNILTDEEIHFYGERFQESEDKKKGVSFELYLEQEIEKKVNLQI